MFFAHDGGVIDDYYDVRYVRVCTILDMFRMAAVLRKYVAHAHDKSSIRFLGGFNANCDRMR